MRNKLGRSLPLMAVGAVTLGLLGVWLLPDRSANGQEGAAAPAPAADALSPLNRCAAAGAVYYVDFDRGSDSNSGRSPTAAWKHAPGDPNATSTAQSTKLQPGDVVQFRSGVTYRGRIALRVNGEKDQPITQSFGDGSTWV